MSEYQAKFLLILLCFLLSIVGVFRSWRKKDAVLTACALFFTVLADFQLIVEIHATMGLVFFICVQIFYNMRFRRFPFEVGLVAVFALFLRLQLLHYLALIYASLFVFSMIGVFTSGKMAEFPYRNKHFARWGLSLYFLCDIFVLFYNLGFGDELVFFIWLAYLPGQLLLALSSWRMYNEN